MSVTEYNLGKVGVTPKGAYDDGATYERLDVVTHAGGSYLSLIDNNTEPLSDDTAWQLLAEKGDSGAKGDKPSHSWDGTKLQFENPDGTLGAKVDLKGKPGNDGAVGDVWKPTVSAGGDLTWQKDSGATAPTQQNIKGEKGDDGDTWKPTVNQDGDLSWSKESGTPATQNIKGVQGDPGLTGDTWKPAVDGAGNLTWSKASGTPESANIKGDTGATGPAPAHQWVDTTKLQFKQPDGSWGTATQLKGEPGGKGADGDPGPGVASGGSDGQVLAKDGLTDYATKWIDPPEGGGAQVWTTTTAPTTSGGTNTFLIANLTGLPNAEPKVGDIIFYQYGGYRVNTVGETTVQTASTQTVGVPANTKDLQMLRSTGYAMDWVDMPIFEISESGLDEALWELYGFVSSDTYPRYGLFRYNHSEDWWGLSKVTPVLVSYWFAELDGNLLGMVVGVVFGHPELGSFKFDWYPSYGLTIEPLDSPTLASKSVITDTGDYFTATDTEGALQELASEFQALSGSLEDGIYLIKPSSGERWFTHTGPLNEIITRINAGTMPDKGLAKYHYWDDSDPDNEYGSTRYFTYEKSDNRLSGVWLDTYLSVFRSYKYDKDAGYPWTFYPLNISTKASGASIEDSGSYFTATHVEGALQEMGALLDGLETALEEL